MNTKTINKVKSKIEQALIRLNTESEKSMCDSIYTSAEQYQHIRKELEEMINQLDILVSQMENSIPMNIKTEPSGISRMIVDTWPLNNALGESIISAEHAYLALFKKSSPNILIK